MWSEASGSPALPQAMLPTSLQPWDKGDLAFTVGQPATPASPGTQEGRDLSAQPGGLWGRRSAHNGHRVEPALHECAETGRREGTGPAAAALRIPVPAPPPSPGLPAACPLLPCTRATSSLCLRPPKGLQMRDFRKRAGKGAGSLGFFFLGFESSISQPVYN